MKKNTLEVQHGAGQSYNPARRRFLTQAGLAVAGTSIVLAGCKKDDDNNNTSGVNLGSGDTGILNYAYALEQLEAAFYTQVIATPYASISNAELAILTDIKGHEIIHRDFFKAALGTNAIQSLEVDFSSIDFNSKSSVLGAAQAFEDLGVAAYNGAGHLISSTNDGLVYLGLAGKIVSVEARHASIIRDLIGSSNKAFAGDDVVDINGLDQQMTPSAVLAAAKKYIKTTLNGSNLPS